MDGNRIRGVPASGLRQRHGFEEERFVVIYIRSKKLLSTEKEGGRGICTRGRKRKMEIGHVKGEEVRRATAEGDSFHYLLGREEEINFAGRGGQDLCLRNHRNDVVNTRKEKEVSDRN